MRKPVCALLLSRKELLAFLHFESHFKGKEGEAIINVLTVSSHNAKILVTSE